MTTTKSDWRPERGEIVVTRDGQGRVMEPLLGLQQPAYLVEVFRMEALATYQLSELRPPTLLEFLFQRTGFGKWTWPEFAVVQLAFALVVAAGVITWSDGGWWAVLFTLLAEVVIFWQQSRSYRRKR